MTIREWCEDYCYQRGMFPDQAKAVIDRMAADPASKALSDVWRKDAKGYPPQFMTVLAVLIRPHALAWIDEHLPKAWYRGMFVDSQPVPAGQKGQEQ